MWMAALSSADRNHAARRIALTRAGVGCRTKVRIAGTRDSSLATSYPSTGFLPRFSRRSVGRPLHHQVLGRGVRMHGGFPDLPRVRCVPWRAPRVRSRQLTSASTYTRGTPGTPANELRRRVARAPANAADGAMDTACAGHTLTGEFAMVGGRPTSPTCRCGPFRLCTWRAGAASARRGA
jgi:hypothetical protein